MEVEGSECSRQGSRQEVESIAGGAMADTLCGEPGPSRWLPDTSLNEILVALPVVAVVVGAVVNMGPNEHTSWSLLRSRQLLGS